MAVQLAKNEYMIVKKHWNVFSSVGILYQVWVCEKFLNSRPPTLTRIGFCSWIFGFL